MSGLQRFSRRTFKLWILGADVSSKLKLVFASFWLPIKKRLGFSPSVDLTVQVRSLGQVFTFYIEDYFDMSVLAEIIYDAEYDFPIKNTPKVIFDLGSNVGSASIYFRLKYPEAKIYAFEADPVVFKKMRKNLAQFQNVFAYNYAISGSDGKVKFYLYPDGAMSSSLVLRVPGQASVEVDAKSLDTLMTELALPAIDFIKFDIEGSEFDTFKNYANLSKTHYLIGEVHPDLFQAPVDEFLALFNNFELSKNRSEGQRFVMRAEAKSND